jgi:hypothetical protein
MTVGCFHPLLSINWSFYSSLPFNTLNRGLDTLFRISRRSIHFWKHFSYSSIESWQTQLQTQGHLEICVFFQIGGIYVLETGRCRMGLNLYPALRTFVIYNLPWRHNAFEFCCVENMQLFRQSYSSNNVKLHFYN